MLELFQMISIQIFKFNVFYTHNTVNDHDKISCRYQIHNIIADFGWSHDCIHS